MRTNTLGAAVATLAVLPTAALNSCPLLQGSNIFCEDFQYAGSAGLVQAITAGVDLDAFCQSSCNLFNASGVAFCPDTICQCKNESVVPATSVPTISTVPETCANQAYVSNGVAQISDDTCKRLCFSSTSPFCPKNLCTCGQACSSEQESVTLGFEEFLVPKTAGVKSIHGPYKSVEFPYSSVGIADDVTSERHELLKWSLVDGSNVMFCQQCVFVTTARDTKVRLLKTTMHSLEDVDTDVTFVGYRAPIPKREAAETLKSPVSPFFFLPERLRTEQQVFQVTQTLKPKEATTITLPAIDVDRIQVIQSNPAGGSLESSLAMVFDGMEMCLPKANRSNDGPGFLALKELLGDQITKIFGGLA